MAAAGLLWRNRLLYGWHRGVGNSLSVPHESTHAMTSSGVACKPVSSKCLMAASQLSCHAYFSWIDMGAVVEVIEFGRVNYFVVQSMVIHYGQVSFKI